MVKINDMLCKGCSYCIKFCPKHILEMGTERSKKGHFYPILTDESACISCGICALMCPDAAIEITKE
jgi:2-oxoglutarate ferredoxin oxidoreductase subunit delta